LTVLDLLHVLQAFEVNKQISPIALAILERKEKKRASARTRKPNDESEENHGTW
jgi:hypothetical protein